MLALFICTLLAGQTPIFVMTRAYYKSAQCDSRIFLISEAMKVALCIFPCRRELHLLFERVHLAFLPVVLFALMNLMSFWAIKRLPAASLHPQNGHRLRTMVCTRQQLGIYTAPLRKH